VDDGLLFGLLVQFLDLVESVDRLLPEDAFTHVAPIQVLLEFVLAADERIVVLHLLHEIEFKLVSCPLDGVFHLIWVVLESADLELFLFGVSAVSLTLSGAGQHDLGVGLYSLGSCVHKGLELVDAFGVDELSRMQVVYRVHHETQA